MACNVFGTPVTDATLKGMTEYHDKPIQPADKARVALEMKNAEGKDVEAHNFNKSVQDVIQMKGVRCLIYNATGGPIKLVAAFEFHGCISESPFPPVIQNGQWAAFVHEKESSSCAAVIYESTQHAQRQWVLGWYHRDNEISKCYAEVMPKNYYSMGTSSSERDAMKVRIQCSEIFDTVLVDEEAMFSTIGNTPFPTCEAVMTHRNAL